MTKRLPLVLGSLTILVWALVLVYFIASGRIDRYLSGAFQVQALIGGIGLGILGLFNLLMSGEKAAACGHDHAHGEEGGCCGHDHDHDHQHDHAQDHKHAGCDHEHHEGCGHDHHEHGHDHGHKAAPVPAAATSVHAHTHEHDHHHEEETAAGLAVNYSILLIPIIIAALITPDDLSIAALRNNAVLGEASSTVREELALGNRKRLALENSDAPTMGAVTETPEDLPPSPDSAAPSTEDSPPAPETAAAEAPVDPYAFTEADLENLLSKNESGDYKITVPEIFYTGGDASLQKVLKGKPFETTGQAMKEMKNNDLGNRMRLYQLFMECCAADARPLSIPVEFPEQVPAFKETGWYRVRGTLDFEMREDVSVPVMKAATFEEVEAPSDGNFYKPPQ